MSQQRTSPQRHVVKRQILELTVRNRADAQRLQADLSRIYRQRIIPLLDQFCTELGAPDRIYRIESLNVDIGALDPRHFEEQFVARASAALRASLARQIQALDANQPEPARERSALELLAFFARSGALPWWADSADPTILADSLRHLLAAPPEPLRRLLRDLARDSAALARIASHFDDEALAALALRLVPALGSADPAALTRVVGLLGSAAADSPAINRPALWRHLLSLASTAGADYDQPAALLGTMLRRLAAAGEHSSADLLAAVQHALRRASGGEDDPARRMLAILRREVAAARPNDTPPNQSARLQPDESRPLTLPAGASPVEHSEQAAQQGSSSTAEASLRHPTPAEPAPSVRQDAALPQESALDTPSPTVEPPLPLDHSFSADDDVHVDNAGLVILWRFLHPFFAHLDLLGQERFKDAFAAQRAVGLLEVLAASEPHFPEYALPLNKVLCGMDWTALYVPALPFSSEEIDACDDLLRAVIEQVPILHDMSTAGFRVTFLRRHGLLSVRDGMWLLQVERETYDVVLERFPWGWDWIKLPWMDTPLRVEW